MLTRPVVAVDLLSVSEGLVTVGPKPQCPSDSFYFPLPLAEVAFPATQFVPSACNPGAPCSLDVNFFTAALRLRLDDDE